MLRSSTPAASTTLRRSQQQIVHSCQSNLYSCDVKRATCALIVAVNRDRKGCASASRGALALRLAVPLERMRLALESHALAIACRCTDPRRLRDSIWNSYSARLRARSRAHALSIYVTLVRPTCRAPSMRESIEAQHCFVP